MTHGSRLDKQIARTERIAARLRPVKRPTAETLSALVDRIAEKNEMRKDVFSLEARQRVASGRVAPATARKLVERFYPDALPALVDPSLPIVVECDVIPARVRLPPVRCLACRDDPEWVRGATCAACGLVARR